MVEFLTSTLQSILDSHAPVSSKLVRRPPAPWMTPEIKETMKKRDAARRKFRRTRLPSDYSSYKFLRNFTQSLVRRAKSLYFHQLLLTAPDSKTKWGILRKLSLCKSPSTGSSHVSPNDLNNHFISSSSSSPAAISPVPSVNFPPFSPNLFFFSHISPDDVLFSVLKSRTHDFGPDNIPVKLLKACLPSILPILYHIYNFSLQNSTFPSAWKSALVRPLKKSSSPTTLNDFRPISLLSNLSKPLERLVQSQLSNYLESNSLLNPLQSGFRPGFSTQSALLKISQDLYTAIEQQKLTILVLLDFSKAFDTVDHQILLSKLQNLSLSSSALHWFQSFLSQRSQFVAIPDNPPSDRLPLARGVPQGSSLSPTLFSVYINDLPLSITHSQYHLYADDSQIYLSFHPSDSVEAVAKLQQDLDSICAWSHQNRLKLNAEKTKAILIGSSPLLNSLPSLPYLTLNGSPIAFHSSLKNLGVVLDQSLSWKDHVSQISRRTISTLKLLNHSRHLLPLKTRQLLVSSLIFPHFDYGCLVYGGLSGELEAKLKRLMNCTLRFIFGIPRETRISLYYTELKWLYPFFRRQYFLASFLYLVIKNKRPSYI